MQRGLRVLAQEGARFVEKKPHIFFERSTDIGKTMKVDFGFKIRR